MKLIKLLQNFFLNKVHNLSFFIYKIFYRVPGTLEGKSLGFSYIKDF